MPYEEIRVLSELESQKVRIDFVTDLEDEAAGKLVCSYYPPDQEGSLVWFYDEITKKRGGRTVVNVNASIQCHEELLESVQAGIPQNFRDAIRGLLMESHLKVLCKLNGHGLLIDDLEVGSRREKIRRFHADASHERMQARSGPVRDTVAFLTQVYEAYCKARRKGAEQLISEIEQSRDLSDDLKSRILNFSEFPGEDYLKQKDVAQEMPGSPAPSKLSERAKEHGFTYAQLIKECAQRWEEERRTKLPLKLLNLRGIDRASEED